MKKYVCLCLLLSLIATQSSASFRNLSLEMEPTAFNAHWWLNYEEQAFNRGWLEEKISCHFDEDHDGCYNLAALLRMYAEIAPNRIVKYGLKIMPKLEYDESHQLEVALFFFLYADDRRYIHILEEQGVEYYAEPIKAKPWPVNDVIKKLQAKNSLTVTNAIEELLQYPSNESMDEALLEPMIILSENESQFRPFILSNIYLQKMGYLGYFNEMAYDFETYEIHPTFLGGVIELSEYLGHYPLSKVWKYHAKTLSADYMNERDYNSSQLLNFFKHMAYITDDEFSKKIKFIKSLPVYQNSQLSMKYQIGGLLMYEHKKEGRKILKYVFKHARPAMKSALVVQYPELFPIKKGFWQTLKNQSTEIEKRLVERNKTHIADRLKQAEINRKETAKRAAFKKK